MLVVPVAAAYLGGVGSVSAEEDEGYKTVGYNCTGSALGQIDVDLDMDVDIYADVPDSVEPGEEFSIENSYTDIELELDDTVKDTANPLEGKVTTFNLEFDNATVTESGKKMINMAKEELPFGPIGFDKDDDTVGFTVPEGNPLSVDLTAGESGDIKVTAGEIQNTVDALGGMVPVEVTCVPRDGENTLLNTVSIEEAAVEESTVTVTYVDEDGKEIADSVELTGEVGETYETEEIDIDGYTFKEVEGEETGEYGEDDTTVKYIYEKAQAEESTVTVLYLNEEGVELAKLEKLTGEVGDTYETKQKDFDGYILKEVIGNKTGEYSEDDTTVKYIYEKEESATDPEDEALDAVNDAEDAEGMQEALASSDLGLNLAAYQDLSEDAQAEVADQLLGETYADKNALQSALDEAVEAAATDPEDEALDAVNDAEDAEGMQEALASSDLGLNLAAYQDLSEDAQAEVATQLLGETYADKDALQSALDKAVEEINESEDGSDGEDGKDGSDGEDGKDGSDGEDGKDGSDGEDGKDGSDGEDGEDGSDGEDGEDGSDGEDGEDGSDGKDGKDGTDGEDGKDGSDGQDGKSYHKDNDNSSGTVTKSDNDNGSGGSLPKTATTNPLFILFGSIMAIGGGALVFIRKKIMA